MLETCLFLVPILYGSAVLLPLSLSDTEGFVFSSVTETPPVGERFITSLLRGGGRFRKRSSADIHEWRVRVHRANNPLANASYSPEGQEPLPKDEFAADKKGYKAADDCGTDGQEASCLPGG